MDTHSLKHTHAYYLQISLDVRGPRGCEIGWSAQNPLLTCEMEPIKREARSRRSPVAKHQPRLNGPDCCPDSSQGPQFWARVPEILLLLLARSTPGCHFVKRIWKSLARGLDKGYVWMEWVGWYRRAPLFALKFAKFGLMPIDIL